jgi:hypothetical protein
LVSQRRFITASRYTEILVWLPFLVDRRIDTQNSNVIRGTYDKVVTPTIVNHMFGGLNMMLDSHDALTLDGGWENQEATNDCSDNHRQRWALRCIIDP